MDPHSPERDMKAEQPVEDDHASEHDTLKYSLLGPSLTKSGQDNVDQQKACRYSYFKILKLTLV
jgi:DNA polymerase kappa